MYIRGFTKEIYVLSEEVKKRNRKSRTIACVARALTHLFRVAAPILRNFHYSLRAQIHARVLTECTVVGRKQDFGERIALDELLRV